MNLAEDPQAAQAAVQQPVAEGADESAAVQQPAGVVPAAVSVSPRERAAAAAAAATAATVGMKR